MATERPLTLLKTPIEVGRRDALKLLAGCMAVGAAGCLEPPGDQVRPYARLPAELVPGQPRFYATSMVLEGLATGVVVESHEGRPTKIEGNPEHPASLGGTMALHQASILDLYDPARARAVMQKNQPSSWSWVIEAFKAAAGPRWLVLPNTSSLWQRALLAELSARGVHVVFSADSRRHAYRGAELVFGRALETQLDLAQADVVLALDAQLFSGAAMSPRWAHDFSLRRRAGRSSSDMSRLYVVEPMLTPTGTLADHRLGLRASEILSFLLGLCQELHARGVALPAVSVDQAQQEALPAAARTLLKALADDLTRRRGAGVITVGERQPAVCHALAHVLNTALGNLGRTMHLTEPVLPPLSSEGGPVSARDGDSLEALATALHERRVGMVAILDCNPVHAAPHLELAELLARAPVSLHVDRYRNETSEVCTYHAPLSHYLESWGDARAGDGTVSIIQPLLRPLYDTRSSAEVLALFLGASLPSARAQLIESLRGQGAKERPLALRIADWLSVGFVPNTAFPSLSTPLVDQARLAQALRAATIALAPQPGMIEVDISPSATLHDERFSNNAWLQELPHPRTKLCWGNAAMLSPSLAARLDVQDGAVLRLTRAGKSIELPALVVPEHAPSCITIELGYGRSSRDERIARGLGANAALLSPDTDAQIVRDVTVLRSGRHEQLARTQQDFEQHERELAPARSVNAQYALPLTRRARSAPASTLPATRGSEGPQWAMTIDTTLCSGCGACVIACQSENNVPVVGKSGVLQGREMHWLRLDTYRLFGELESENVVQQPMMCQHCEHAPCEYVCPVFATEHSPDGLNEMVYNRCIGTRFCSQNCPYKVRRFNWMRYTADAGTLSLQRNPEVTVRDRGVMEKCTYCVQRIRGAEHKARMEKRPIAAGEVVTACQQACPTQAIQFGALSHSDSEMVRGRESPHAYGVLSELGTRPRTQYLAKLQNPHPSLGRKS